MWNSGPASSSYCPSPQPPAPRGSGPSFCDTPIKDRGSYPSRIRILDVPRARSSIRVWQSEVLPGLWGLGAVRFSRGREASFQLLGGFVLGHCSIPPRGREASFQLQKSHPVLLDSTDAGRWGSHVPPHNL